MDSTRLTIAGAVTVSLVAVGIFWATLPESGLPPMAPPPPAPVVARAPAAPPPPVKPSPRPSRPQARAARPPREGARAASSPQAGSTRARLRDAAGEGAEVPEDVLEMIDEARAERVASSGEKLARYAELAKWDAERTEKVQGLMAAAHDEVDALIAGASAGEVPWTDVRGEVRRIRMDQARAVRDEIGEEEFRRFAKVMARAKGGGRGGAP